MDRKATDSIVTAIGIDIGKNTFHLVGSVSRFSLIRGSAFRVGRQVREVVVPLRWVMYLDETAASKILVFCLQPLLQFIRMINVNVDDRASVSFLSYRSMDSRYRGFDAELGRARHRLQLPWCPRRSTRPEIMGIDHRP